MLTPYIRRAHERGGSVAITIPPKIIKVLHIEIGDNLLVDYTPDGVIRIRRISDPMINPRRVEQPA